MTETAALTAIIARCPDLVRQATDTLRAWRADSPIREQRLARTIIDALRLYGEEFTPEERASMAALLPETGGDDERRSLNLIVRATLAEKDRVKALADAAGQSVSDYIRQRIGLG